jgi:phosphatidylglycerol---prolipoprotein diacylglyceryl transferase
MTPLLQTVVHPFAYRLGWFEFTGFGLAVLLAFVCAQITAQHELARRGHDPQPVADLIFAAVIGGLVGAKLYYVLVMRDAGALFSRAGFVFWGGLIGGIVAVVATAYAKRLDIMRVADVGGLAIPAAYAIGRTGCWAVGDDYGRPWSSALAVSFPDGAPPSTAENMRSLFHVPIAPGTPPNAVLSVYPTQLFEVAMGFAMFLVLWRLRNHKHAEGWLFGVYCVLAGAERFLVEFFRAKDDRIYGAFTVAQVIAVLFMAFGVVWMYARKDVRPGRSGIYGERLASSV